MKRPAKAITLGILSGALGIFICFIPFILDLEEAAGLDWLFNQRGAVEPPDEVIIISIDKQSADALQLSTEPGKWPRSLHTELLQKLSDAGAAVIVLDIYFKESRDTAVDAALADAIETSNRVVLFEYTKKDITRLYDKAGHYSGELIAQRLSPPVEPIASAALALAPFPLPVFPVRVSQFWAFTPGTGDLPTEPVVALQLYFAEHYPTLLQLMQQHGADIPAMHTASGLFTKQAAGKSIKTLRNSFIRDPALADKINTTLNNASDNEYNKIQHRQLHALVNMYSKADSHYLNFYGPPQTITTVPYINVLQSGGIQGDEYQPVDLQGKAVFVGYSERLQPEQLDEFYTVYSQNNGLHLSGVEIAATAFANLMTNRPVTPLPMPVQFVLLAAWGLLLGTSARLFTPLTASVVSIGLAALYLLSSQYLFNQHALWLPLVAPLLIQLPFALFVAVIWHYLDVRKERENIRTAFGLYLPSQVVDELANDLAGGKSEGQLVYGTCLSTDAEKYTTLSEGMSPDALGELMNAYYEILFAPVRKHDGIISDVVGDAMLAIWTTSTPDPEIHSKAIQAALAINEAVKQPEVGYVPHHLPTRLGLHSGQIMLGSIGAGDHFEYRAVGDIVNTSTRIQGMNAYLGTRILLTEQVLEDVSGFLTRDIGSFVLAGKTQPLVIHELIGYLDQDYGANRTEQQQIFAAAIAAFRLGDWTRAQPLFARLCTINQQDGVSRYYLEHCRNQQPDAGWSGAIHLNTK